MKKFFFAIGCSFCVFMIQTCDGMKSDLIVSADFDDSHSKCAMCPVVDNPIQIKTVNPFAQNDPENADLLDIEDDSQRAEAPKVGVVSQGTDSSLLIGVNFGNPVFQDMSAKYSFRNLSFLRRFFVLSSRVCITDLSRKSALNRQIIACVCPPVFRAFTNSVIPTGTIILPKTRIDGVYGTMVLPPARLEYTEWMRVASWIYEISSPLSEVIILSQQKKWKEACEVSDQFFKHKFKDFVSAEESATKLLVDFLHSVSIGLGIRLCETQTEYDCRVQQKYGPCYAFCTIDHVNDLFEIWNGKAESGRINKDILQTAAVYLYVLHNFQCSGSINPQYSTPYQIAFQNMLQNGVPTRNFISWALKMASLDSETKKIAVEWGVRPSL
ncbi:MAG: hypothetical protein LBB21_05860 [Holosporaceae bacterium]|nr:hypothetical protein [Holosporaceae bacterium]